MRILSVQYLRAIAAILVVVAHAFLHPIDHVDVTFRRMGSFGVLLFFVISGFIMVYTTGKGSFAAGTFFRRRIERIVPLYWIVTIGLAFLAIAIPSILKNTTFSWEHLTKSLLFIPYMRENGELVPLMKLGWTLNYEIFFYLTFAACASLSAIRRFAVVTGLFVILVIIGFILPFNEAIPKFYTEELILSFCVGMGIGLLHLHDSPLTHRPHLVPVWALCGVVFTALAFSMPAAIPLGVKTDALFTLASAMFILLGLCAEKSLPVSRPALILGDASYAMYLTHMYFVAGSIMIIRKIMPSSEPWIEILASIMLSILIAIPVHRLVELPATRFLRRL